MWGEQDHGPRTTDQRTGVAFWNRSNSSTDWRGKIVIDRSSSAPLQNPYRISGAATRQLVCIAAAQLIEGPLAASDTAVAQVATAMCIPAYHRRR